MESGKPSDALVGKWEVTQVAVDLADQPHWLYVPDDPRLLNRELRIAGSELSIDTGEMPCKITAWRSEAGSLEELIGKSFARPPKADTPTRPTLADFSLQAPAAKVTSYSVKCTQESAPWSDAWLAMLSRDRLLMRFGSSALLSLKRQSEQDKPRPSYGCDRASNDAERTICGSTSLAGLDRSIAAAYKRAKSRSDDDVASLEREQADWLKSRNACAKDSACLNQRMLDRIEELMQY